MFSQIEVICEGMPMFTATVVEEDARAGVERTKEKMPATTSALTRLFGKKRREARGRRKVGLALDALDVAAKS